MTDDELRFHEEQVKAKMLASLKHVVDQTILFGAAGEQATEAIGLFNCRCTLILLDCPWIDVIDMVLHSEFGDTDPRILEFRDL